jgi:putative peptidoglycan lipid II flippase
MPDESSKPDARPKDRHFLRAAGTVSAAVGVSRITGVVREMVMARFFGASATYDAFLLGFRIPNLTRDLFAEGAFSAALAPTFSQSLSTQGKKRAAELSNVVATALLLAVGALCILGMIFSPHLVRLMAPGFAAVPGKFELATLLVRVMFPFLALVALAAHAMAVLNANDRYGVPALASTWFNLTSVAAGLAAGFTVGRYFQHGLIVCMAGGVVAGGAMQFLSQLPEMRRIGFAYGPRFNWNDPGLRQIGRLMLPAVLGGAALQINMLVNTNLASSLTDASGRVMNGPVSWLSYAFRFMQLPLGIFGVALASATVPAISRNAALGQTGEFRGALARSIGLVMLLTVPASAGLMALGPSMVALIYEGGKFTPQDTQRTAAALAFYSLGLAGYAASKVLAPAFYALNSARSPMVVSLCSVGVNLAAAVSLVKWAGMGYAGLALSTSLVALAGSAALFEILRRRIGGIHGRRLVWSAARIVTASVAMGVICRLSSVWIKSFAGSARFGQAVDIAVSVPLGAAVFYILARAFRIEELEVLRAACYTSNRDAPRLEVGDPSAGNR